MTYLKPPFMLNSNPLRGIILISKEIYFTLCRIYTLITINVPQFKKLRDIIFFWWDNHFMSHFEGHFEGAKTFLTP
jgi:hypothetical protein